MSKIIKLTFLFFIVIMVLCPSLCGQISRTKDFEIPKRPYKVGGVLSTLIEEEKYYNFRIKRISSLREGYVIRAITHIDRKKIDVVIVSPFSECRYCERTKLLKEGKQYSLSLQRYFIVPAKHIGSESGPVADVLLGDKTVNINNSGFFYYIFSSYDLNDKYVCSKATTDSLRAIYYCDSMEIHQAIMKFVEFMCFEKHYDNLLDTLQMKKAFLRYGGNWHRSFDDQWWPYGDRNWWLDSVPKRLDWGKETLDNKNIDTTSFCQLFQQVSSWHRLPLPDSLFERRIINVNHKFLYYTNPGIYTMHVKWEIEGTDKIYAAIVNVQKFSDSFRITALNKPYNMYLQGFAKGNRWAFEDNEKFHMLIY